MLARVCGSSANQYQELPKGCRVVSTEGHGVSFWANTGRIDIELADGSPQSFFIKVISNESGKEMMHGEFESMSTIHNLLPDFVPEPMAWGTYDTIPDTHFFLCHFREMIDEMPDPQRFTARLAALHEKSRSPEGKFGFHVTTYTGNLPQANGWEASWETYFAKSMRRALDLELEAKGPDPEFDTLVPVLFDKVIPRLLRPLESDGRSVKPSLVHGDLWYANSGIDVGTGESLIFDACSFYAHNECTSPSRDQRTLMILASLTCTRGWSKTNSASGGPLAIGSAPNTWQRTTLTSRSPRPKRTTTAVWISTNCEGTATPRGPPHLTFQGSIGLTRNRRFNAHVSALFTQNRTLREQYGSPLVFLRTELSLTFSCRMLGDIRDLVQRWMFVVEYIWTLTTS